MFVRVLTTKLKRSFKKYLFCENKKALHLEMNSIQSSSFFETPIEYVKGVGPARAELLKKEFLIYNVYDMLTFYPFRYVDRTQFYAINKIEEEMPYVQIRGILEHLEIIGQKRGKRLVATLKDKTGSVELVWFQGQQWMAERLQVGKEYVVFGKANLFNRRMSFSHPEIDEVTNEFLKQQSSFEGVYSSTEKLKIRGLGSDGIRKIQRHLVQQVNEFSVEETLPEGICSKFNLMPLYRAFQQIHFPENEELLERARFRLKYDELFYIQLRLLRVKQFRSAQSVGFVFQKVGNLFNAFYHHHLPFTLTGAQKKVLKEIRVDVGSGKQMNRLLQGDVGSGKTLVALMAMLLSLDNGFQACLMAPTEILARQHFQTFSELLVKLGIVPALLTGSTKTKGRKKILSELESGELQILIGTHALLEDKVKFKNLGLAVIDEQHRFELNNDRACNQKTQILHIC